MLLHQGRKNYNLRGYFKALLGLYYDPDMNLELDDHYIFTVIV